VEAHPVSDQEAPQHPPDQLRHQPSKSIITTTPHLLRQLDPPWECQPLLQAVDSAVASVAPLPLVWLWVLALKSLTKQSEELWEAEAQATVITSKPPCSSRLLCSKLQFSMLSQQHMVSNNRRPLATASTNHS